MEGRKHKETNFWRLVWRVSAWNSTVCPKLGGIPETGGFPLCCLENAPNGAPSNRHLQKCELFDLIPEMVPQFAGLLGQTSKRNPAQERPPLASPLGKRKLGAIGNDLVRVVGMSPGIPLKGDRPGWFCWSHVSFPASPTPVG